MFLLTNSFFALYGRPSTIFFEYASPIPGNAFNWSSVAVLMSSFSPLGAVLSVDAVEAADLSLDFAFVLLLEPWAAATTVMHRITAQATSIRTNVRFFIGPSRKRRDCTTAFGTRGILLNGAPRLHVALLWTHSQQSPPIRRAGIVELP